MSLTDTFHAMRDELRCEFLERNDAIDAMLLALLTKEHCHLDGDPGTGKSMLVRAVARRINDARYFEQVLSRTRPDAAILGPYDINALRERSEFRRKDAGYLTTCDIGYLDEIFKMSPTLGHDLLAVLNERLKHEVDEQGLTRHPVPLWTTFTSSNEIPHESDEQALWDRILLRVRVEPIKEPANVHALLTQDMEPGRHLKTTLVMGGVRMAHEEAMSVIIPVEVTDLVQELRRDLREQGITVSDRRWRASVKVVRAQAWLSGRETACAADLAPLRHVLWSSPEEAKPVRLEVQRIAQPDLRVVSSLEDDLAQLVHAWTQGAGRADKERLQQLIELKSKINQLLQRLKSLAESSPLPETSEAATNLILRASSELACAIDEVGLKSLLADLS